MGIFNHRSRIIETLGTIALPHYALHSSRKLIPLKILVWRSPDMSLAATDCLPRHHKSSNDVDNFRDIIDMSEVVITPSAVQSKMHLQISGQSNQAGNIAETQQSPLPASQAKPTGKPVNQTKNIPSSKSHDVLKFSLRQRLHARIDHWLAENMANLVEDALQATPQSRTKPIDKPEKTRHQALMTMAL